MKKVVVIGAGAAGMMAAISAAQSGASVTLIEKNEKTGKKIFITGKGRCNVTNGCGHDEFFDNIVTNSKFLYSAYATFDNRSMMELLEENGCPLKEERGKRIFPQSDHSSDVIAALNRLLKKERVKELFHTTVKELLLEELPEEGQDKDAENPEEKKPVMMAGTVKKSSTKQPEERICGVLLTDGTIIKADAVIVATGGQSYEATGSTGDGYRLAMQAGHTVKEVKPALVSFVIKEEWCRRLQGLSLKNVSCLIKKDKKKIYEGFGEMLFTHFGVSGPLILSASSFYVKKYRGEEVQLFIDLKPALTREQLDARILRDFDKNTNKQFKNALDELLPAKMIPIILSLSGVPVEKRVNEITREERSRLVELLKNLTLTITGTRGFSEAIVTQGGVNVKEIFPASMESRKAKNLYFAGEVLDVDALTGGFNLQVAWSTGFLAGKHAAGYR